MLKILEVLRLHAEANLSDRAIARSLTMSHATVGSILRRGSYRYLMAASRRLR